MPRTWITSISKLARAHAHTSSSMYTQWHTAWLPAVPPSDQRRVAGKGAGVEACCLWLLVFGGGSLRMSADPADTLLPPRVFPSVWFVVVTSENQRFACFIVLFWLSFNEMQWFLVSHWHTITHDSVRSQLVVLFTAWAENHHKCLCYHQTNIREFNTGEQGATTEAQVHVWIIIQWWCSILNTF